METVRRTSLTNQANPAGQVRVPDIVGEIKGWRAWRFLGPTDNPGLVSVAASVAIQTELVAGGLKSSEARAFLAAMPTAEALLGAAPSVLEIEESTPPRGRLELLP